MAKAPSSQATTANFPLEGWEDIRFDAEPPADFKANCEFYTRNGHQGGSCKACRSPGLLFPCVDLVMSDGKAIGLGADFPSGDLRQSKILETLEKRFGKPEAHKEKGTEWLCWREGDYAIAVVAGPFATVLLTIDRLTKSLYCKPR